MVELNKGYTNLILEECKRQKLNSYQTAYVLATAWWETGQTMMPVREAFGESTEQSIARLENAWNKGQLTWVSKPYWRKDPEGKAWFGRGFVQLTFKENYERASGKLGIDLTTDPDQVMEPEISVKILVRGMKEGWFTGKRLDRYISDNAVDYKNARRVVNGLDKASTIARLAQKFQKLI